MANNGEQYTGGEGGIRTPDRLAPMPHFECGAFNHSATSPGRQIRAETAVVGPCSRRGRRVRQGAMTIFSRPALPAAIKPLPARARAAIGSRAVCPEPFRCARRWSQTVCRNKKGGGTAIRGYKLAVPCHSKKRLTEEVRLRRSAGATTAGLAAARFPAMHSRS